MSVRLPARFTKPQFEYLKALIINDLDNTDLTPDESGQARAALRRINQRLATWDDDWIESTNDDLTPFLDVPAELATSEDWKNAYQRKLEGASHD